MEEKTKVTKVNLKRKEEILSAVLAAAMDCLDIRDVLQHDAITYDQWLSTFEATEGAKIVAEAMKVAKVTDDEMATLMWPLYARGLESLLGATKVTIKW